jgi:uncharacterized protein (DUF433 family)
MPVELSYPHITKPRGAPAHLERVPRIRVAQIVMDYLAHAWSAEEICRQHPYLKLAEAHAAMAYYYDHQQEIDDEIRSEVDQTTMDRGSATRSPFFLRLRAKGLL